VFVSADYQQAAMNGCEVSSPSAGGDREKFLVEEVKNG
jgi:hypothetical protein